MCVTVNFLLTTRVGENFFFIFSPSHVLVDPCNLILRSRHLTYILPAGPPVGWMPGSSTQERDEESNPLLSLLALLVHK